MKSASSFLQAELLAEFDAAGEGRDRDDWRAIAETCLQLGPQTASLEWVCIFVRAPAGGSDSLLRGAYRRPGSLWEV